MSFNRRSVLAAGAVLGAAGLGGLPWRSARAQAANTIDLTMTHELMEAAVRPHHRTPTSVRGPSPSRQW